jgi:hypothetical protein
MQQLGPNAFGEVLESGRVPHCYLGLLLPPPPAGEPEAGTVLIVAPPRCSTPASPSPPAACSTSWSPAIPTGSPASLCSWPTSLWSCAPGRMAPGPRWVSTRR